MAEKIIKAASRPDSQAIQFLLVYFGSVAVAATITVALGETVGWVTVFNSLREAQVTGLLAFSGLSIGIGIQAAGSRRYIAVAYAFGFLMALGHLMATMAPRQEAGSDLLLIFICPFLFITGIVTMFSSSVLAFQAHIDEGEGKAIPFPTRKIEDEP
ncbi:hypothetical protein HOP61_00755 [Halomonas daqingensis]|uniref:Uncharacterized protein n=1 Tax=Billgrantia desiderata TaxID=52021 RepID=A0AAW4YPB7_9GAMM|nr:hypothetical protein [Halomonas desiderata]MCE8049825.1 hypothetical protein [Halomonas desiderata]